MAIEHQNIPDANLHNPKGFASAANSTVAKKNSGGSLEWGTVDTADITDGAVTNSKVADTTLGSEKFQTGAEEATWVAARLNATPTAGTIYSFSDTTLRTTNERDYPTYEPLNDDDRQTSVMVLADGTITVEFEHRNNTADDDAKGRILKNGTEEVEYTILPSGGGYISRSFDVTVVYGDIITWQNSVLLEGSFEGGDVSMRNLKIGADIYIPVINMGTI